MSTQNNAETCNGLQWRLRNNSKPATTVRCLCKQKFREFISHRTESFRAVPKCTKGQYPLISTAKSSQVEGQRRWVDSKTRGISQLRGLFARVARIRHLSKENSQDRSLSRISFVSWFLWLCRWPGLPQTALQKTNLVSQDPSVLHLLLFLGLLLVPLVSVYRVLVSVRTFFLLLFPAYFPALGSGISQNLWKVPEKDFHERFCCRLR